MRLTALLLAAMSSLSLVFGTVGAGASARGEPPPGDGAEVVTLVVPPYLDSVVFDVVGSHAGARVEVFPPGDLQPLPSSGGVEEIRLGRLIHTITVDRPQPGEWTFRQPQGTARVHISSRQYFPRGVLVEPAGPVRQHTGTFITYRVTGDDGVALEELPGYPLSLDVVLTKPDGTSVLLAAEARRELGRSTFRTRKAAECDLVGRYWTEVTVTTHDLHGETVTVFRDRWSGFTVEPPRPITCTVVSPRPGATVALYHRLPFLNSPVPIELQCRDSRGQPIDPTTFTDAESSPPFVPTLYHHTTAVETELDLALSDRKSFRGVLRGAQRSGSYRLSLASDDSAVRSPFTVAVHPRTIRFARRAGWGPVPLALLLAAGLAVVGWVWATRSRHPSR